MISSMKRLEVMLLTMASVASCLAQTNQPALAQQAWDHLTNQVHMTAYVSNNVVVAGSNIDVFVRFSNTSTNQLGVFRREFGDINLPSMTIDLISSSGQVCNLNPGGKRMLPQLPIAVFSGTTNELKLPVDIKTNIGSGNYNLRLTQTVLFVDGDYEQHFKLEADVKLVIK